MDQLITFALKEWPGLMSALVLFIIGGAFLGLPLAALFGLNKLLNKDRYVFVQNEGHLYRLDTSTGKIYAVRGIARLTEMLVEDRTKA